MKRFLLVVLIIPFLFMGCSHSINSELSTEDYSLIHWNTLPYIEKVIMDKIKEVWTNEWFYSKPNQKGWWELLEIEDINILIDEKLKNDISDKINTSFYYDLQLKKSTPYFILRNLNDFILIVPNQNIELYTFSVKLRAIQREDYETLNETSTNPSNSESSIENHSLLHPYLYGEVYNSYFSGTVPFLSASSIFPRNVDNEELAREQRRIRAAGEDFLRSKIYEYNINLGVSIGAAGNCWSSGSFEQYDLNQWTFTGWAEFKEGNPVVSKYLIVTYSVSVEYR